jgi:hypothetical protein
MLYDFGKKLHDSHITVSSGLKGIAGLFFRISLKEKSGEYEISSMSPQPILGYVISEGVV